MFVLASRKPLLMCQTWHIVVGTPARLLVRARSPWLHLHTPFLANLPTPISCLFSFRCVHWGAGGGSRICKTGGLAPLCMFCTHFVQSSLPTSCKSKCTLVSELCCSWNSPLVVNMQLYAAEWFVRISSWAVSSPVSNCNSCSTRLLPSGRAEELSCVSI